MSKKTYAELLRDPRWQKKRLEIMQRDSFECQNCGDKLKTLHVHHVQYLRNRMPWDYPNNMLQTLCLECHEIVDKDLGDMLIEQLFISGMKPMDIHAIACDIYADNKKRGLL